MADENTSPDATTTNATDHTEPVRITFADVTAAPYRIREGVPQTPCEVGHSPVKYCINILYT